jgi:hypothetical protein
MPIEHRRIAFAGGAITTPDPDWRALRSAVPFGDDLEAGEIRGLTPQSSSLIYWAEIADGVLDGDPFTTPTPSGVTIDVQVITVTRDRGEDVYTNGGELPELPIQRRAIETELAPQGNSVIRVISAANLAGSGAIIIWADEEINK